MKPIKTLLFTAITLVSTSVAQSQEYISYWSWQHDNGTDLVGLKASGNTRQFIMVENSSGIGITPGQTVFSGTGDTDLYTGTLVGQYLNSEPIKGGIKVVFNQGNGSWSEFNFKSKTHPGSSTTPAPLPTSPPPSYNAETPVQGVYNYYGFVNNRDLKSAYEKRGHLYASQKTLTQFKPIFDGTTSANVETAYQTTINAEKDLATVYVVVNVNSNGTWSKWSGTINLNKAGANGSWTLYKFNLKQN